ncbi:MAG TPA: hypothetical protein VHV77_10770, partial [Pirellulales bacterium]|nr:hypothetical protein [Pirellulales bacterium]
MWWLYRPALLIVLLCCRVSLGDDQPPKTDATLGAGDHLQTLESEGEPRSYFIHVPASYDA